MKLSRIIIKQVEDKTFSFIRLRELDVNDEPQYCDKNVATLEATNFNYQPGVHTNLRGIDTICATYNVSLFC